MSTEREGGVAEVVADLVRIVEVAESDNNDEEEIPF